MRGERGRSRVKRTLFALTAMCAVLAVSVLLHQYLVHGVFVEWEDVLHHETAATLLIGLAVAFGVAGLMEKRGRG